ncbi:transposase [Embleya sp. NPDC127516]|uniref:transposase n=1 Tax=Embleya sp. NPDC127516 TaxID=3363990 RepID=UPI00381BBB68
MHQRVEAVGKDRTARLPRQLSASPRILSRQAPLAGFADRDFDPALPSQGGRMDPPPPRLPRRDRTPPAQSRSGQLPGTRRPHRPRPILRANAHRTPRRTTPDWLDAVRQDDLPGLHTLAAGIDRDRDAVIAGLTLPWNSGVVEGHVNRIKMLKRQMFGRAGFRLLRKRVLLA